MKRITNILAVLIAVLVGSIAIPLRATYAQGDNLLQNPGMEQPYAGMGLPNQTAPVPWRLWTTGTQVTSFPHIDKTQIHGGAAAWNINKGFQVFTAGGYQTVSGIGVGSIMRASFYGLVYTCNNEATSCLNGSGQRISDQVSGASIKVGIDPSGGTDPNSSQIVWSSPTPAYDNWTAVTVDAKACNTSVTIFLYATQALPMALNNVYFDDASLRVVQAGAPGQTVSCANAVVPGGSAATAAPPTQAFAPFVQKQPGAVQPDGSIVHTVVAGDTLAAIAVAYGITLDEIRTLNNFKPGEGGYLVIGQKIIVRGPTPSAAAGASTPALQATVPGAAPTVASAPAGQTPVQFTEVVIPTITPTPGGATPIVVAQLPPAVVNQAPGPTFQIIIGLVVTVLRIWLTNTAAG